ncbi:MAG: YdcF family protein [Eggerthellaceae bacterium]|nr:YdcF family protein [Eggerthellaceae bacterium]
MLVEEKPHFRTVGELSDEVLHLDEDLPAEVPPAAQTTFGTYDAIVVLGAAVRPDGTPSPILEDRIRTGVELYQAGVAPKIIMSGDNTSDRETYNEVVNMKNFAVEQLGVPSADVFCDHAGLNTYDSMYRAYHVFGVQRIVVVTQSYHLYRALFDAESFHMQVAGVPSDLRTYAAQPYYDLREVAARVSDYIKVRTRANATILSEPVSLSQSGDVTTW